MKKGFTLIELLISIVIITMILMIVLVSIKFIMNKNNDDLCSSYKDMVVEYVKISDKKDKDMINLNELDGLDKVKKECTGYVSVDKTTTPYTYTSHLNCLKCPNS